MTVYKIDANRGDDSNDGINNPFKNLNKIGPLVLTSGDSVLLAADSKWNLTSHINLTSGWTGTNDSPITIGRYFPYGVNTGMPQIQRKRAISAKEWTYDQAKNGWYFSWFGVDIGWSSYIKVGGEWATRQEAGFPLSSIDGAWKEFGKGLVYVYAPSNVNPTDYYGSVYFAPSSRGTFSFSNNGTNVIIEDIETIDGGSLAFFYSNVGERLYRIRRCSFKEPGVSLFLSTETAGIAKLEVTESEFSGGSTAYIHTYGSAGFGGIEVYKNKFFGGNEGYPQGNVYLQAKTPGKQSWIHHNEFEGALYGSWSHKQDGCAVYAEVGCDDVLVEDNIVRNTYTAFQDNSGRNTTWRRNIILNCHQTMQCTDESNVGQTNHIFNENTILGAGVPMTPNGPTESSGIGWWSYRNVKVEINNNLFSAHPNATPSAAIELGTQASGKIENNIKYGNFTTLAQTYLGTESPIVVTGTIE